MTTQTTAIVRQNNAIVLDRRSDFRSSASSFCRRLAKLTVKLVVGGYTVSLMACAGNGQPIIMKMGVGKFKDSNGKIKEVATNVCRQENAKWGNTIVGKCHIVKKPNGEEELVMDDSLIAVDGEVRGGAQIITGGVLAGSSAVAAGALVHAADNPAKTIVQNSANNTNVAKSSSDSSSGSAALSISDAKASSNAGANSAATNVLGNGNKTNVGQVNYQLTP